MDALVWDHDHVVLGVQARRDRPEDLSRVVDVHILVHGDRDLRMQIRARQDPQQHVPRLAVPARRHLDEHREHRDPRRDVDVVDLGAAVDLAEAPVEARLHRHRHERLVVGEDGRLHVAIDRVPAPGDRRHLEDRRRAFGALAVAGELAERPLGLTHARRHDALDDDLGLRRDLEVDGLALHELERLAQDARAHLELVVPLVPAAEVGEDLVAGMEPDRERHRCRETALLVLHEVRPVVARRHPEAHLPRSADERANDRLVAHPGVGVLGDGDTGAEVAARVALGVDRNRELRDVGVGAEQLHFLARAVGDDLRAAGHAREHAVGELAHDALRRGPERLRLALAILHQDVAELPAREAREPIQKNRPGAGRAERAGLGDRIDLVVDADQVVAQCGEEVSQVQGHGRLLRRVVATGTLEVKPARPSGRLALLRLVPTSGGLQRDVVAGDIFALDRPPIPGISGGSGGVEFSGGATMAVPAKPNTLTLPYTGKEFLESLDDGREVWIYGERVKNITTHPAFQNCARMLARLYDALHEDHALGRGVLTEPTEWGGFTHRYFRAPTTVAEQVAGRDAIAAWARLTYGWLGRSPDYKAAFLGTLGANAEFYAPYQDNARRWYRYSQERVPFINHAIIHPPVDRNIAPGAPGGPTDVYARVTKETDAGIYVSGAKVVATGSALTHFTFVAHHGLIPVQGKDFAIVFMVPTNAKGVKLICRVSNELRAAVLGSPFDYPLSSRLDENDAIFVMDDVFVPWEDVLVHADVEKANNFFPRTGFLPRALIHGCTRLAVKLDFITGLLIKATEITGTRSFRGVEANIGEVIAWRNMIWGLSDAMAKSADPWTGGCILPAMEPAAAYQVLAPEAYVQVKNLIEKTVASGLIYLNSHARDFKTADLRKYLDLYLKGSGGVDAVERVKLMKLLWDAIGTEFGGRHELYEINYSGSHEEIRRYALFGALGSGQYDRWKQFAETCMAEYDLDGWTAKDLVNARPIGALQ